MKKRTNIEIAYDLLKRKGGSLSFIELWQSIVNEHEYSEVEGHEQISKFYTLLIMDGRFVNLGDNVWTLREFVPFDEIELQLSEVYSDIEEGDEEDDEETQEIAYFDEEESEESKSVVGSDDK